MEIIRYETGTMGANCYLVYDPAAKKGVIIDPGYPDERIVDKIADEGLTITHILLTHGHFDHIGGLKQMREAAKAPVAIHQEDAAMVTSPAANLSGNFGGGFSFDAAEVLLGDGDTIAVSEALTFSVITTPGHTPGGVCFISGDTMFSGDTLFSGSIGRTDFPGGDYGQMAASLKRLMTYPDEMVVYPGHGPATTIGRERAANPFIGQLGL